MKLFARIAVTFLSATVLSTGPLLAESFDETESDSLIDESVTLPLAACAGGPAKPAYAYNNFGAAQACAQKIASYGPDCAAAVKVGKCVVTVGPWVVNSVNPMNCVCYRRGEAMAVGYWTW